MSESDDWHQDNLLYRIIHGIAFECYYWYSEVRTAIESGMEEAGWRRKGE